MRKVLPNRLALLLFLTVTGGLVPAAVQTNTALQSPAPTAGADSMSVYVVDFRQVGSGVTLGDLGSLPAVVAGIIQLRLLQVPSLTVRRVPVPPQCGTPSQVNRTAQVAPPPPTRQTGGQAGDFYVVRGSIEPRLPDFVLDYFVEKCTGQNLQTVVQDTEPFTADHALDQLTMVAHAIAFRLERSSPPTTVVVEAFDVESESHDQKDVRDALRKKVSDAVSESSDLLVADTGDYRVGGQLTFEKAGARIRFIAKRDTVRGDVYILAHEKKYPLPPVMGSRDDLAKFYADVAAEVVHDLPEVLLAEHLGWSALLGNMETKALLSQGAHLLDGCSNHVRTCDWAQDAIPLLAAATQKDPSSEEGFRLLGQAQVWAGKYAEAAQSLEKGRNLIRQKHSSGTVVPPKDETDVLNSLGDAYRNMEKYPEAEAVYSESLLIGPAQLDVYTKKALALRDDGKRAAALATLLDGLEFANSKDALTLHDSAKGTIRVLLPGEFPEAKRAVTRAATKGIRVADEYALLIAREQGEVLDTKWTPESAEEAREPLKKALGLGPSDPDVRAVVYANLARTHLLDKDPQQIDSYLTQGEKLPPDQVSPDNREWIARIRARFWLNQKVYAKAYASADAARQIRPTDEGAFMEAEVTFLWARDKAAGANPTPEQKGEIAKLYQQTADLTRPLVEKRFPGTDGLLTEANHSLDLDAKTREQFQRVVIQNPKDDSALNALMLVCSQYLFDFDCAFSAAKKDALLHEPNGPDAAGAYVNVAEAAILANNDAQARSWLAVALKPSSMAPREKALVYLYALWLAIRQGHTDQLLVYFQSWQKATEEFRQTNDDLNWIFLGARKVLHASQIEEKQKALLLAMMDALEHKGRHLPVWTD